MNLTKLFGLTSRASDGGLSSITFPLDTFLKYHFRYTHENRIFYVFIWCSPCLNSLPKVYFFITCCIPTSFKCFIEIKKS